MTPEISNRIAKMLRLVCDRAATDGEKLAALNRLSAIVVAQDLDWDRVFANGNGSALTEAQMERIYSEGYSRGHADGLQEASPVRDWTPTGGTSSEAGDDTARLMAILRAAEQSMDAGLLNEWEVTFVTDMTERFNKFGSRIYVSEKQWAALDRLEAKLRRQEFL